jgi:hypothetical protein
MGLFVVLGVPALTSWWTFVPWLPPLIPLAKRRGLRERPLPTPGWDELGERVATPMPVSSGHSTCYASQALGHYGSDTTTGHGRRYYTGCCTPTSQKKTRSTRFAVSSGATTSTSSSSPLSTCDLMEGSGLTTLVGGLNHRPRNCAHRQQLACHPLHARHWRCVCR